MTQWIELGQAKYERDSQFGETALALRDADIRAADASRSALVRARARRAIERAVEGLEMAQVVTELTHNVTAESEAEDSDIDEARRALTRALQEIRVGALAAKDSLGLATETIETGNRNLDRAAESLLLFLYHAPGSEFDLARAQWVDDRLRVRGLLSEAEGARDRAVEASQSARRAAGVTGDASLAEHFRDYADEQREVANRLRLATILTVLGIAAVTAYLLLIKTPPDDLIGLLGKLAFGVPSAALAAYLGKESSRHRTSSRWAREMAVQLLTLDAFTEPLGDESRQQLRSAFGARLFAAGDTTATNTDQNAPSAVAETGRLLDSVSNLIRREPPP